MTTYKRLALQIAAAAVSAAVLVGFQNCAKVGFNPAVEKSVTSVEPLSISCVQGKRLGIWLDPDRSGRLVDANYLGSIVSYQGSLTGANNYNYFSASAHPVVGPTPQGYELNVFFYEGTDGLSMSFFSNVDSDDKTSGSANNYVNIDSHITNNNAVDRVLLSDDNLELKQTANDGSQTYYEGRFHYTYNTDGGVIGPIVGDRYKIQMSILSTGDIQNARFFSANGQSFTLKDNNNNISSFVITYQDYETCQ